MSHLYNKYMENIQWFPGHMAKGKRLIEKYKSLIDIFIVVVDSRVPYSSIHNSFTKNLIPVDKTFLIFAKPDLADPRETDKWVREYKKIYKNVIPLKLTDNNMTKSVLERELNKYFTERDIKRKQIMVLGVPNVGKSTMINSLAGKTVARVENRPSVTRGVSWITTKSGFRIFDTPGILEPKIDSNRSAYNLAIANSIKNDILNRADIVEYGLKFMMENYPLNLVKYFDISEIKPETEFFEVEEEIIKKKGFYLKNKEEDYERFFIFYLKALSTGKLGRVTFDKFSKYGNQVLKTK